MKQLLVTGLIVLFVGAGIIPQTVGIIDEKTVFICLNSRSSWTEQTKLLTSDGTSEDYFGFSVDLDGDTAIIGAYEDDDNGLDSGSAYLFIRIDDNWTEQAKLLASDGEADDWFGWSVALDGNYAIIGALGDDDNGYGSGSAYVFTRSGSVWTEQVKLLASDGEANDRFGWSVAIDGDTAIIGAYYDDDNGDQSGSAYVFTRSGSIWTEQAKLLASDGEADDRFGVSVSIKGDTTIIGACLDDDQEQDSGSAYVFTRSGTVWTEQAKLLALYGGLGDWFGRSISLDGDYVLIGASGDNTDTGSAYIFKRSGVSWVQEDWLIPSDGEQWDFFGLSVSLDGDTAIIGAWGNDDNGDLSGSAYVFTRSGSVWTEQAKLLASDGASHDSFGISVALDNDTALIGSRGDDEDRGAAYVFTKKNDPPNTPTITGPTKGKIKADIEYNFTTTDSDGDNVFYYINWGDETNSGWIGPYPSGIKISRVHSWNKTGRFSITVKAKDIYDAESNWSEEYFVDIYNLQLMISGGLGIKVTIINNGTLNASDIPWQLHVEGGILNRINKTVNGTIDIVANYSKTVKTAMMFGFGSITAIVKVADEQKTVKGTQLIIFSMIKS